MAEQVKQDYNGHSFNKKEGKSLFIKHVGNYVCHDTVLLFINLLVQTGSSLKEQRLCVFHLEVIHVSHYALSCSVMANSL